MRAIKESVTRLTLAVPTLTLPVQAQAESPVAFQVEGAFSRFNDDQAGLGSQDLQFNNVTGGIRLGVD